MQTSKDPNPLPHMPILGSSNSAEIKIWCQKYGQIGVQLSDWVENIVGKEEIARYKQFLLFPQCFQKLSVVDESKWALWSKGLRKIEPRPLKLSL